MIKFNIEFKLKRRVYFLSPCLSVFRNARCMWACGKEVEDITHSLPTANPPPNKELGGRMC
jgi:hypothetical protein